MSRPWSHWSGPESSYSPLPNGALYETRVSSSPPRPGLAHPSFFLFLPIFSYSKRRAPLPPHPQPQPTRKKKPDWNTDTMESRSAVGMFQTWLISLRLFSAPSLRSSERASCRCLRLVGQTPLTPPLLSTTLEIYKLTGSRGFRGKKSHTTVEVALPS